MPLNSQDLVRLRAELLRHVDNERGGDAPVPFDPEDLLTALTSELEAAAVEVDPVPRAPFPSHRHRTAWLVRGMKGVAAWLTRPLSCFLVQRQADLNRRMLGTMDILAELVRALTERQADRGEHIAAWSADQARARDERLLVLDTLASVTGEVEGSRIELGGDGTPSDSRLRHLEHKLDELARLVAASHRRMGGSGP